MAIPLNEEIREEAKKMSEFVIEDTKRTVEMLNWMKEKATNKMDTQNVISDVIKAGASVASGNIANGAAIIAGSILPRLRDIKIDKIHTEDNRVLELTASLNFVNRQMAAIRELLHRDSVDLLAIDDICFDIQTCLIDSLK